MKKSYSLPPQSQFINLLFFVYRLYQLPQPSLYFHSKPLLFLLPDHKFYFAPTFYFFILLWQ